MKPGSSFSSGCVHAMQLYFFETKLPDLKWKTRPELLLGSLPLVIALPDAELVAALVDKKIWFNVIKLFGRKVF
jgi:hypothetical protein